jgi:hypothetical protein
LSTYAGLRGASRTLADHLLQAFKSEPDLVPLFGPGGYKVSLRTPTDMRSGAPPETGLSAWLYRIERSETLANRPLERLSPTEQRLPPVPVDLHYLMTPITDDAETNQLILGKVLQALNDGAKIAPNPAGTELREALRVSPENLDLEAITRIWQALEGPYELSASYLVHAVELESYDRFLGPPVAERRTASEQIVGIA